MTSPIRRLKEHPLDDAVYCHGGEHLLHRELEVLDTGMRVPTGLLENVLPDAEVEEVQLRWRWWPHLLWPQAWVRWTHSCPRCLPDLGKIFLTEKFLYFALSMVLWRYLPETSCISCWGTGQWRFSTLPRVSSLSHPWSQKKEKGMERSSRLLEFMDRHQDKIIKWLDESTVNTDLFKNSRHAILKIANHEPHAICIHQIRTSDAKMHMVLCSSWWNQDTSNLLSNTDIQCWQSWQTHQKNEQFCQFTQHWELSLSRIVTYHFEWQ